MFLSHYRRTYFTKNKKYHDKIFVYTINYAFSKSKKNIKKNISKLKMKEHLKMENDLKK